MKAIRKKLIDWVFTLVYDAIYKIKDENLERLLLVVAQHVKDILIDCISGEKINVKERINRLFLVLQNNKDVWQKD